MVFEINVFQWLSHGTFNGFSQGMCVDASTWSDYMCELGLSQTSSRSTSRALPRLASPPRHRDPKISCLEKKDEKMETYPKVFYYALPVYPCARKRCAADFLRAARLCGPEGGQPNLCIGPDCVLTCLIEEFAETQRYFNTRQSSQTNVTLKNNLMNIKIEKTFEST